LGGHPPVFAKRVCKLLKTKKTRAEFVAKRGARGGNVLKTKQKQKLETRKLGGGKTEGALPPPCKCVNTLDKGVTAEMYGKAADKGLTGELKVNCGPPMLKLWRAGRAEVIVNSLGGSGYLIYTPVRVVCQE
jgi:hypothetical protein